MDTSKPATQAAFNAPAHSPSRFNQLDGLRGLAALTVVFSHFTLLDPLIGLRHTPFRLLSGGHEAVVLFFVLSGFVLSLQFESGRAFTYGGYAIRRICRIFIPYVVSVAVAVVAFAACYGGVVKWAGLWFNASWTSQLSAAQALWHVAFLFPFKTYQINPIYWSLLYEMRISLLFPLLMLAFARLPTRAVIGGALAASILVCAQAIHANTYPMDASGEGQWLPTIHYVLMFAVGAALAKHRAAIQRMISGGVRGASLTVAAALLYVASRPLSMIASGVFRDYAFDWIALLAVAGIICAAISFAPLVRFLESRPVLFLGRISFSLYLYHALVLMSVVHLIGNRAGAGVTLLVAAGLILPVSYAAYMLVERPGMRIGGLLAKRMASREQSALPTL